MFEEALKDTKPCQTSPTGLVVAGAGGRLVAQLCPHLLRPERRHGLRPPLQAAEEQQQLHCLPLPRPAVSLQVVKIVTVLQTHSF